MSNYQNKNVISYTQDYFRVYPYALDFKNAEYAVEMLLMSYTI